MNAKIWLSFFLGIILALLTGMILYLFISGKNYSKELIPSITTCIVTLAALYFGYQTNKEQQKILKDQQHVQIRTTIQKEWVDNVRIHLSEIIAYYLDMETIITEVQGYNLNKEPKDHKNFAAQPEYKQLIHSFVKNRILLSLYLNFNHRSESELYDLTSKLWKLCAWGGRTVESGDIIIEIQNSAQAIFKNKLEGL